MRSHGEFSASLYETRFGSWNKALEAAGIELNQRHTIPKDELLNELQRLADELGHTPSNVDMSESGRFDPGAYERQFGSWNAALEEGGFELNNRYGIPNRELLEELRRLHEELDHTPRRQDMTEWGRFSSSVYEKRFSGWNAALEAAGMDPIYRTDISEAELLNELQRLADELGYTPGYQDMTESGSFGGSIYQSRFGSWNNAVDAAGLEPNVRRDIPEEELLDDIRRLGDELDRTPRFDDMSKYGSFSPAVYQLRFGTWNQALEAVGYDLTDRIDIPTDEIIEELQQLADELDRVPRGRDMVRSGRFGVKTYTRRFGGWHNALEEAGLEPPTPKEYVPSGADHYNWKGGVSYYNIYRMLRDSYGEHDWEYYRKAALERDDYKCQMSDCDEGVEAVHHIDPVMAGGCNASELLLCLCAKHHNIVEHYTETYILDRTIENLISEFAINGGSSGRSQTTQTGLSLFE